MVSGKKKTPLTGETIKNPSRPEEHAAVRLNRAEQRRKHNTVQVLKSRCAEEADATFKGSKRATPPPRSHERKWQRDGC